MLQLHRTPEPRMDGSQAIQWLFLTKIVRPGFRKGSTSALSISWGYMYQAEKGHEKIHSMIYGPYYFFILFFSQQRA